MNLLNLVSVKNAVIVLVLTALIFGVVKYVQYNGNSLAWCLLNANDCRVARIQALERNYADIQPKVADESE